MFYDDDQALLEMLASVAAEDEPIESDAERDEAHDAEWAMEWGFDFVEEDYQFELESDLWDER